MDNLTRELSKSSFFPLVDQPMTAEALTRSETTVGAVELLNEVVDSKYKILRVIGSGGMGSVYLAKHLMLDKNVALKTFKSSNLSQDAKARFQREAQAIAKLNNPNIVQVFDFGYVNEQLPYYTMEVLTGQSLGEKLEDCQFLEIDEAIEVFIKVCRGLVVAHKKGIIHRDLKPENIFLESESLDRGFSNVKIVDFGIAALATPDIEGQKLTAIGTVFGSPLYMSPEQAMGKRVTASSDIYSCGCALFQALTGKPPYLGTNAFTTLLMHQSDPIPSLAAEPDDSEFPPALEKLVTKMLAKAPADRYQSAEDVLENLLAVQQTAKIGQSRSFGKQLQKPIIGKTKSTGSQSETAERDAAQERNLRIQLGTAFLAVLLLLAAAYYYFSSHSGNTLVQQKPKPQSKQTSIAQYDFHLSPKSPQEPDEADYLPMPALELKRELASPTHDNRLTIELKKLQPEAIEQIANTKWINGLSFKNCDLPNANLGKLAKLNLFFIHLNSSTFNDIGAAGLSQCKHLKEINASCTGLSDEGLRKLVKLKDLTRLTIGGTKVTKVGLSELAKCKKLKHLSLANTRTLGTDEINYVAKIASLDNIILNKTNVSADLVRVLCKNLKNCKNIELRECPEITSVEGKQLKSEFPSIRILID